MIKKLSAMGLLILLFGLQAAAGERDDNDIFFKFLLYTGDVYLVRDLKNLDASDFGFVQSGKLFSARILGYSLGNLLQYARRGSENHEIWLMLERKTQEAIFGQVDWEGRQRGWDRAFIEKRKQNAWTQCMGAQQGWYNAILVATTAVRAEEAPNFFDTLATVPPVPPIQPPAPPPINPPAPPIQPPAPPAPSSKDAVAGTYKVTGKSWENDPRCGSLVTLTGSMNEVEAEFKLWDWTGVTMHYKGPAKWDGRSGNDGIRDLKGKTQWLTYPHIFHDLSVRIMRGADGVWRATGINIGGNLFQLAQIQSVERPIQAQTKTLTIKNTTAFKIDVYLNRDPNHQLKMLGSVDSHSSQTFNDIPERGRWYIRIDPPPDTNLKSHLFTLYVKESEQAYFYEVLEGHLK